MPDFREVAQQATADEHSVCGKIFQRDGKPYLAADGSHATISVIGSESKRYKKLRAEIQRKAAEAADDSDEAMAATRIALAAAAVTAWHGARVHHGERVGTAFGRAHPGAGRGGDRPALGFFRRKLLRLIKHVRYEAMLDQPFNGGAPEREHLKLGARAGSPEAIARLRNPHRYPESLRYLHEWALEIHQRSGFSEVGVNPMTWTTLHAWATHTGREPTQLEVDALFALDVAMMVTTEAADG